MILCVLIEMLGKHLDTLAPLMDQYQRGDMVFADNALKWLEEAEKVMSSLRLVGGSEMTALRGSILGSADAMQSKDEHIRRGQLRKIRESVAAESLKRAEEIMRGDLLSAEERLKFFEDKLCEGMTAFLLQTVLPNNDDAQSWLDQIWQDFRQQDATRPLATYITASLSPYDRTYILSRVMERASQNNLGHLKP